MNTEPLRQKYYSLSDELEFSSDFLTANITLVEFSLVFTLAVTILPCLSMGAILAMGSGESLVDDAVSEVEVSLDEVSIEASLLEFVFFAVILSSHSRY